MVLVTVEALIQGIARTFTLYGSRNIVFALTLINGDVSLMFSRKSVSHKIVERFNRALVKIKQSEEYQSNWEW